MRKNRDLCSDISAGCSFNAEETPDGIIRFSGEEAVQLCLYVVAMNRHQGDVADLAEPRVRKTYVSA